MVDASASQPSEGFAHPALEALAEQLARAKRCYAMVARDAFRRGLVKWAARRADVRNQVDALGARRHALAVIRRASLKSAVAGAVSGAVSTGAAVYTAETSGWGALAAVPVAVAAMGVEAMFRAVVHVDLACELAEAYGVPFDTGCEDDLWRLYALVFQTCDVGAASDRGKGLVERIIQLGGEEIREALAPRIVRDTVLRDAVPFVSVFAASVGNFTTTWRLGNTMRRFLRYERAMSDALEGARIVWPHYLELLVEGVWFLFTADGTLTPEETAMLAHMLRDLDPVKRGEVTARFTDDERDWIERVRRGVLPEAHEAFLYTLEVAAALDKKVVVPERKLLRRVSEAFELPWTSANVERLIAELAEAGVARQ